jgi:hypothetical protein
VACRLQPGLQQNRHRRRRRHRTDLGRAHRTAGLAGGILQHNLNGVMVTSHRHVAVYNRRCLAVSSGGMLRQPEPLDGPSAIRALLRRVSSNHVLLGPHADEVKGPSGPRWAKRPKRRRRPPGHEFDQHQSAPDRMLRDQGPICGFSLRSMVPMSSGYSRSRSSSSSADRPRMRAILPSDSSSSPASTLAYTSCSTATECPAHSAT